MASIQAWKELGVNFEQVRLYFTDQGVAYKSLNDIFPFAMH